MRIKLFTLYDAARRILSRMRRRSRQSGLRYCAMQHGAWPLSQLPDEDAAHYKMMLSDDIRALKDFTNREKITMLPVFAYPYGYVEPTAEAVFREQGFAATMTSEEHVNLISRDKECLYQLGRLNRSGKMTTAQLISWMNNGKGQ